LISAIIELPDVSGCGVELIVKRQLAETTKVPASMMSDHEVPIVEAMTPPMIGPMSPLASVPEKRLRELPEVNCSGAINSGSSALEAG
jgi:hypothetical protein